MSTGDPTIDAILDGGDLEYAGDGRRRRVGSATRTVARIETPRRRFQRLTRTRSCVEQIGHLPAKGEELLMILDGRWHGWDLVESVLQLAATPIVELRVATLGFNRANTEQLCDRIDAGEIGSVRMLVSEMFRDKSPNEYEHTRVALAERNQVIGATRNHAKLICFRMEDGRRFTADGSLNLRRCNSFEQCRLTRDEKVYDFFTHYIDEQVEQATQPKV